MDYPFFERIKSRLAAKNETVEWLANHVGKNSKTIYNNKSITDVSLEYIMKLTTLLQFDFLRDYSEWLKENNQEAISTVQEPAVDYKTEKKITVEIKITAGIKTFGLEFAEILEIIKREGEKRGFTIE